MVGRATENILNQRTEILMIEKLWILPDKKNTTVFELTMFYTACGSVVDEDANFCKSCGRGTFLNLKCSYLHFF